MSCLLIVLVLPDSLDKIGGDSNIQCPVALTGKDVHARLLQAANFLDTCPVSGYGAGSSPVRRSGGNYP